MAEQTATESRTPSVAPENIDAPGTVKQVYAIARYALTALGIAELPKTRGARSALINDLAKLGESAG